MRDMMTLLMTLVLLVPCAFGQEGEGGPSETKEGELVTTTHSITVDGGTLSYEVTAGELVLENRKGEARAHVFHTSYVVPTAAGTPPRPVSFVFNGGPGSSSVWLHMGGLGPKRVLMTDEGKPLPPPGRLVDNPHTWLDRTDLVFIDPVGTGYSRPAEGVSGKDFWGLDEDISSVGDFIRLWVTKNGRWTSPKFLAGESYGTTRAAGLAGYLQSRHDMYLNGIMLISPILNFATARFDVGNDLPYPLFLPTYTATAFYHGRLPDELQKNLGRTLAEVERFALGEYWTALAQGDRLPKAERAAVARKLARFTGLTTEWIENTDLRIHISKFCKELLRGQDKTVGRLDSRFQGKDRDSSGVRYDFDPSMAAISGPYSAAIKDYFRGTLRYETDRRYNIMGGTRPWSYGRNQNRYVNVAETLRSAMHENRNLHVWVASGYYDLATPYFAMDYTASHMQLDPALRENLFFTRYESGHMMYIHVDSLKKLEKDFDAFMSRVPTLDQDGYQ